MEKSENKLGVIFGDSSLGVRGERYHAIFSYERGGLLSLKVDGNEWIYRPVSPAFWRATTDNDRGSGFNKRAAQWLGADMFPNCVGFEVTMDGKEIKKLLPTENDCWQGEASAEEIAITYYYKTLTAPAGNVRVTYTAQAGAGITVSALLEANGALPELPCFGLRFILPTAADGFTYEGLMGETYPDRMAGAERGVFEVQGLPVTTYLVPQECGMHMETERLTVTRSTVLDRSKTTKEPFSLTIIKSTRPFAFSCLPYTPEELECALHQEELPPARRTVLTLYGAVRGVGGINSWGADILKEYRLSTEKDISFDFIIDIK